MKIKLICTFIVLYVLVGCENKSQSENESFKESTIEVMNEKNNPIPKYLYSLPSIQ